jgi:hypothetical protein
VFRNELFAIDEPTMVSHERGGEPNLRTPSSMSLFSS